MALTIRHTLDDCLDLLVDGQLLFRYTYHSTEDQWETPKPRFHPLRTLSGDLLSCFRPHDHLWHHGLAMTLTVVNDQNFWGGNTFVKGQGYVALPNTGRQQHVALNHLEAGERPWWEHQVHWITSGGELWLDETRRIEVTVNEADGWYRLDFQMSFQNVSGQVLTLGSPTTEGRENAGYMGLMWRGARDLAGGKVLLSDDRHGGDNLMGERSPWLAFQGNHDETSGKSTLLFIDSPTTPGHPLKWFVRSTPAPLVACAFCFEDQLVLQPGDGLKLQHAVVVADSHWVREELEAAARA